MTSFVYDELGNVTFRTAHFPGAENAELIQVTRYVYGASAEGTPASDIDTYDLLSEVHYPAEDDGEPGATAALKVFYGCNRQGELTAMIDQNENRHDYTRDGAGRVTADIVDFYESTEIDEAVDRLIYAYDVFGRLTDAKTQNDSTVLNAIKLSYDPLWRIDDYRQNPETTVGGSNTGTNGWVEYAYSDVDAAAGSAAKNYARLNTIKYPREPGSPSDRTVITMNYGSANALDDVISRPRGFSWDVGATNHSLTMQYVGLGLPIEQVYPVGDLMLSRFIRPDFTDPDGDDSASGEYPVMDKFGRIRRHV